MRANLPYTPGTFDLITCTNALHNIPHPLTTLMGLEQLLVPSRQLVLEDFAKRPFPFPWTAFECLMKRIDPQYIHAYTQDQAQALCTQVGLRVACGKSFPIDWLWNGWVLRTWDESSTP